jgi:hypothetical protein
MPSMPLSPNTMYTLHVGGGMMGSGGSMMGAGWRNADGMYGMMFSFTTG